MRFGAICDLVLHPRLNITLLSNRKPSRKNFNVFLFSTVIVHEDLKNVKIFLF